MKGYNSKRTKLPIASKKASVIGKKKIVSKPKQEEKKVKKVGVFLSNNDRVIQRRAMKAGMTIEAYKEKYPKGYVED